MNKTEIAKAQGKATAGWAQTAALVLDTANLYYERSNWGQAARYHKSQVSTCKQDRLGCVTNGWLVMVVTSFGWCADMKERTAKAEEFIKNFTGTAADALDEKGHVRRDVIPADVNVILMNNRNLMPRPAQTPAADGPIRTQAAGDGVNVVEDARLVVRVAVAEGTSYPWLRADNAAKAYAKEFGNGAKLVRVSNTNNVYVYNWAA